MLQGESILQVTLSLLPEQQPASITTAVHVSCVAKLCENDGRMEADGGMIFIRRLRDCQHSHNSFYHVDLG